MSALVHTIFSKKSFWEHSKLIALRKPNLNGNSLKSIFHFLTFCTPPHLLAAHPGVLQSWQQTVARISEKGCARLYLCSLVLVLACTCVCARLYLCSIVLVLACAWICLYLCLLVLACLQFSNFKHWAFVFEINGDFWCLFQIFWKVLDFEKISNKQDILWPKKEKFYKYINNNEPTPLLTDSMREKASEEVITYCLK